jgi:exosome complex component RRP45
MRDTPLSLNEEEHLHSLLSHGKRADGRELSQTRPLTMVVGPANGHVECCLGNTRILAVVTATLEEPLPQRPTEGFFNVFVELSSMAGPEFIHTRSGTLSTEIARIIDRGLRESNAIDVENLCVNAASHVWSVRCALNVLDHDGNLIDACNAAAVAALMHFRRPECTMQQGGAITVHDPKERLPLSLGIHHIPICLSFGLWDGGNGKTAAASVTASSSSEQQLLLLDPTRHEQSICSGSMTITANQFEEICSWHKSGGLPIAGELLLTAADEAAMLAKKWCLQIQKAVEKSTNTLQSGWN